VAGRGGPSAASPTRAPGRGEDLDEAGVCPRLAGEKRTRGLVEELLGALAPAAVERAHDEPARRRREPALAAGRADVECTHGGAGHASRRPARAGTRGRRSRFPNGRPPT